MAVYLFVIENDTLLSEPSRGELSGVVWHSQAHMLVHRTGVLPILFYCILNNWQMKTQPLMTLFN